MVREKTLDLLVKLKAMADESQSGSPEEAAIAAARMQELMFKHKISMAELSAAEDEEPIGVVDVLEQEGGHDVVSWKLDLLDGISRSNFCRVIYRTATRKRTEWVWKDAGIACELSPKAPGKMEVFGRKSDVDTVVYLYLYLCKEIARLAREGVEGWNDLAVQNYRQQVSEIGIRIGRGEVSARRAFVLIGQLDKPSKRRWLNAFRSGAVHTICERLRQQRKAQEEALMGTAAGEQCAALVRRQDAAVQAHIERLFPRLSKGSRTAAFSDGDGYTAGCEAGRDVSLGSDNSGKALRAKAPQLKSS